MRFDPRTTRRLVRALPAVSPDGLTLRAPQSNGSVRRVLRFGKPNDSRRRRIRTTRFQPSRFRAVVDPAAPYFVLVSCRHECSSIIVSSGRRSRPGPRFGDLVGRSLSGRAPRALRRGYWCSATTTTASRARVRRYCRLMLEPQTAQNWAGDDCSVPDRR
jgi:hypothetical protein